MKKQADLEQIERAIEARTVAEGLQKLEPKRRKSMADLLEKIRGPLMQSRQKGVSFRALSDYLREQGIRVSIFTLQRFLSAGTKVRKRSRKASRRASGRTADASVKHPAGASGASPEPSPGVRKYPWKLPAKS
jgi:hypothetical protein